MNTNIIYVSSNTDPQVIDTISLPEVHSVHYTIHASCNTNISVSKCHVTHDGINIGDTQSGFTQSNTQPLEYSTDITDYTGRLLVTPSANVTTFTIYRDSIDCNVYSENTQSGRLIPGTEGFSLELTNIVHTSTVRQANNNQYTGANTFIYADALGPIATKDEKLDNTNFEDNSVWIPYNDIILTPGITDGSLVSYNNFDNFYYQTISVVPGRNYRISGYASTSTDSSIRVSSSLENNDLIDYKVPTANTAFNIPFAPVTDTVYFSIGHGSTGSILNIGNVSLKETAPFHTYDQTQGTIYVKWNNIPVDNNLLFFNALDANTRSIHISSSDIVIITESETDVNVGIQNGVNKLAFSYSDGSISACLNGGSVVTVPVNVINNVYNMDIIHTLLEFSYVPEVLPADTLIRMTI
jgi:hypothetical protein